MNRRIAVRGIIVRDGKMLGLRLKQYAGKDIQDANDYWCTPGGGVEAGEPLLAALERELVEELGVKPVIGVLLYVQQFTHGGNERMEFFFQILNADDYMHVDLSRTTHGAIEIEEVAFIDPAIETVLPAFLQKQELPHDDHPVNVQFFNYL